MSYKIVKLGEICDFQGGSQPPKSNFIFEPKKDYIRFIQIRDFKSDKNFTYIPISKKNNICKNNDILIGRYGASVGKILTGLSGAYNVALMKTIPNEKIIDKKFLYYYLISDLFQKPLKKISERSAQNGFSKDNIYNFSFTLPTLLEQQHIVAKLDTAFAEIDKTIYTDEQKILKINLFKQALLKCEFNIDSKKTTLSKVVEYDKQNGQGSNLPYIGMENISGETMKIVGEINVPEKTSSTFKFNNSHVLFGRLRPYLKKVLIPNFEGQCSTEIFCLKPSEKINKNFLAYWLLSPSVSYKINNSSTGARMPRANMKELLNYQFPVLSLSKQQQIVTKIDTAFATIDILKKITEKKITDYQSLKLSILSQEIYNKAA